MTTPSSAPGPLAPEALRWRCDPAAFDFETTASLEPAEGVVGQDGAVEALRFGLEIHAPGQNVFVRGLTGTGRSTLVQRLMKTVSPCCELAPDRCYVFNFQRSDHPRLLTLPRGRGEHFRRLVDGMIDFIKNELAAGLGSEVVKSRSAEIEAHFSERLREITQPFETELREAGYGMLVVQAGAMTRQLLVPLIDGEPAPPEKISALRAQGQIPDAQMKVWDEEIATFSKRLEEIGERIQQMQLERVEQIQNLVRDEARGLLEQATRSIRSAFTAPQVRDYLDGVIDDVLTHRLGSLAEDTSFTERYRVNLVLSHDAEEPCPTLLERTPSVQALLGTIDVVVDPDGDAVYAPHMMIRGGALLQADGGYLVLDANDLLAEPGAWRALTRTLRSGMLELLPTAMPFPMMRTAFVKPEPIPIDVKVVLLGDGRIYHMLDQLDPDFSDLFKVLADFDSVIDRDDEGLTYYAKVVARIAAEAESPPFGRDAVAALSEHGARIAAQAGKLTARFGRLGDLAREAAFLAERAGEASVSGDRVREAVRRSKQRANLPSRRFQEMIRKGVIRIHTCGQAVGQVNGLAVIQAGQLTYGFPNRITATIGPGRAGTINVEGEAAMSGRIHTKGFLLLGGLMRTLLRTDHPLTFSASIAFEQSYGGVDGDSASGIEFCCLISALTEIPLHQGLAMTGAIDQVGNVLPIGGVNEKIEGFYDACRCDEITGTQGVIIPQSNAGDLMLRDDVVAACADGSFSIYAVSRIEEALSLLSGREAGARGADGHYPPDSVLGIAVQRARAFWEKALAKPDPAS